MVQPARSQTRREAPRSPDSPPVLKPFACWKNTSHWGFSQLEICSSSSGTSTWYACQIALCHLEIPCSADAPNVGICLTASEEPDMSVGFFLASIIQVYLGCLELVHPKPNGETSFSQRNMLELELLYTSIYHCIPHVQTHPSFSPPTQRSLVALSVLRTYNSLNTTYRTWTYTMAPWPWRAPWASLGEAVPVDKPFPRSTLIVWYRYPLVMSK